MKSLDALFDKVPWRETGYKPHEPGLPYATHEGVLKIGNLELDVVQLNTGERLITEDSMIRFIEALSK